MKNRKIYIKVTSFIIIMSCLYFYFLFINKESNREHNIKFFGICLCFLFSFIIKKDKFDTWLVRMALLFTVISDWLLVIEGKYYIAALITFTFTQIFYAIRIWFNEPKKNKNTEHIIIRIILIVFFILIIRFLVGIELDLLLIITVIYFSNLLINLILSAINIRKNFIFPIGLLLFILCDIMVGLNNISDYIDINEASFFNSLINNAAFIAWVFYFPSQAILALSIITNKIHTDVWIFVLIYLIYNKL